MRETADCGGRLYPLSQEEAKAIANVVLRKCGILGGRDEVLRIRMDTEGPRFVWRDLYADHVTCPHCGNDVQMTVKEDSPYD